ncbi:MAG: hypothetical protein JSS66_08600 [Armatimonadetes bacterium]|nr:hypothetical protein [Armatimonadota bacterium]
MATCYRCGRKIEDRRQLRRRVKTGEWVRRRYPKTSVSHTQAHFGMRIVCKWCAGQIDRSELRQRLHSDIAVLVALVLLVIAMLIFTWGR